MKKLAIGCVLCVVVFAYWGWAETVPQFRIDEHGLACFPGRDVFVQEINCPVLGRAFSVKYYENNFDFDSGGYYKQYCQWEVVLYAARNRLVMRTAPVIIETREPKTYLTYYPAIRTPMPTPTPTPTHTPTSTPMMPLIWRYDRFEWWEIPTPWPHSPIIMRIATPTVREDDI